MRSNKDKTGVWHGTLSAAIVLLVVVALSSCVKEPFSEDQLPSDVLQLKIALPGEASKATTEPGTSEENRLDEIGVLVFDAQGQLETKLSIPNLTVLDGQPYWENDKILIVPIKKPEEPKNIYVLANSGIVDIFNDNYTEEMLKNEQVTRSSVDFSYPLLMSGSALNVNLKTAAYFVTVDIARQAAKVRAQCSMTKVSQDKYPNIKWFYDAMKIAVGNVPQSSYVIERDEVNHSTFLNSGWLNTKIISSTGGGYQCSLKDDNAYISENRVAGTVLDEKKTTYIIVQLPYQNTTTGLVEDDNYYKLYVNNPEFPAAPHSILRNTIYEFKIELLGMGLPYNDLVADVNIEDQLTVLPWEVSNIDVEAPQHYFNIDRTMLAFQHLAESQSISLTTDVPEWKLVNKVDGTTFFQSTDVLTNKSVTVDGIKYTLGGTATQATITVSKLRNEAPTIPKQEFTFVARNLKVPFAVGYDNGFIPNSVLSQSFTSSEGILQGWPTNTLPLRGLQLAKRGNKKLPHNMAGADDERLKWKTEQTMTTGTVLDIGFGNINTEIMIISSVYPIDHPAAKYCREMGPEWFLPSRDEWLLIYNQLSTLGASYSFYTNHYWSSTGGDATSCWYVYFSNGFTTVNAKTLVSRIRCVRYI